MKSSWDIFRIRIFVPMGRRRLSRARNVQSIERRRDRGRQPRIQICVNRVDVFAGMARQLHR